MTEKPSSEQIRKYLEYVSVLALFAANAPIGRGIISLGMDEPDPELVFVREWLEEISKD